jgi:hypothetical protein
VIPTFLVECFWPGVTRDAVESATRRAQERVLTRRRTGSTLRFLGSWFVPGDETVFFQYSAGSPEDVVDASREAQLPYTRITASLWFESEEKSCDPSRASSPGS